MAKTSEEIGTFYISIMEENKALKKENKELKDRVIELEDLLRSAEETLQVDECEECKIDPALIDDGK